jgi:hypothetical protein|eukprot:scaffold7854_cov108-Alexandrium_tamarense.AAC.6
MHHALDTRTLKVNFNVLSSYRSIEIVGYSACEEEHSLNNYVTLNENDGEDEDLQRDQRRRYR